MKYAIRKRRPDRRTNTCGFKVLNGQVVVIDLSFDNYKRVMNIVEHGYLVTESRATPGNYMEDEYDLLGVDGKQITMLTLGLVAPARPELDYLNDLGF